MLRPAARPWPRVERGKPRKIGRGGGSRRCGRLGRRGRVGKRAGGGPRGDGGHHRQQADEKLQEHVMHQAREAARAGKATQLLYAEGVGVGRVLGLGWHRDRNISCRRGGCKRYFFRPASPWPAAPRRDSIRPAIGHAGLVASAGNHGNGSRSRRVGIIPIGRETDRPCGGLDRRIKSGDDGDLLMDRETRHARN